jgi:NADPH:quinone reductase
MRAARIHEFGGTLQIDDVPEPQPAEDEVVAELRFIGVNPIDVWVTEGTVAGGTQTLPFIPGVEAAGEVDGEPVLAHGGGLGVLRDGLYRERAAVASEAVLALPGGLDPRQAAALGVAGATAWRLVHDVAPITERDRVLVLGATGGVGSLVVQLARAVGVTVWGQTSSAEKASFLEELLVDRAVVASAEDLEREASGLEATVVIDPLGDGFTVAAVRAMAPFGRIVLYGTSAGHRADVDLRALYRKSIRLLTYSGTIEPETSLRQAKEQVLQAVARGDLRVPIDEVLPLEKAAEAHRRIKEKGVRGKLLLAP